MPISNEQWRMEVGKFYPVLSKIILRGEKTCLTWKIFLPAFALLLLCMLLWLLLLLVIIPMVLLYSIIFHFRELDFDEFIFCTFNSLCELVFLIISLFSKIIVNHAGQLKRLKGFFSKYLFFCQIFVFMPHLRILLLLCGDVESNPGPNSSLHLCHWNLNS